MQRCKHRFPWLFRWLTLLLATLVAAAAAHADGPDFTTPRFTVLSGWNQAGVLGQLMPQRFSVRLTDANGVPFVGAAVTFSNPPFCTLGRLNFCNVPPQGAGIGSFVVEGVTYGTPTFSDVLTDAKGVATSHPYLAGDKAGAYQMGVTLWNRYGFDNAAVYSSRILIPYRQLTESEYTPVPTLGEWAQGGLVLLLAAAGVWGLRRRVKESGTR